MGGGSPVPFLPGKGSPGGLPPRGTPLVPGAPVAQEEASRLPGVQVPLYRTMARGAQSFVCNVDVAANTEVSPPCRGACVCVAPFWFLRMARCGLTRDAPPARGGLCVIDSMVDSSLNNHSLYVTMACSCDICMPLISRF